MVIIVVMGIGLSAPPFALGYFAAARSRVPPSAATRHIWPYLGVLLIAPIIVVFFPAISTTLL
jgi:TRAP-type C4-dicarboxylate transport system permease large subunit